MLALSQPTSTLQAPTRQPPTLRLTQPLRNHVKNQMGNDRDTSTTRGYEQQNDIDDDDGGDDENGDDDDEDDASAGNKRL